MKTATLPLRRNGATSAGLTLVELLCAMAMVAIALGAAVVTFIGVQRSLCASLYQMNAQGDENRVFAYLRRDLRGASAVQITAQGTQVTITVPTQTAPTFNLNLGLSLLSLLTPAQSAPATTTIEYYRQGTSIIRQVNGAPTELSSSATQFDVILSGTLMEIDAGFQPRYSFLNGGPGAGTAVCTAFVHLLNTTAP